MKLQSLLAACLVFCVMATPSFAQDATDAAADQSATKKLEAIKDKQNSAQELNKFFATEFTNAAKLMQAEKVDEAEKAINELEQVVKQLSPTDAAAKTMVDRAKRTIPYYRSQLQLARTTVEELKTKLDANPSDLNSLRLLVQKYSQKIGGMARSNPVEAEKALNEFKKYTEALAAKADDDKIKTNIKNSVASLSRMESTIKSAKKLMELVGKPAADLKVDAWVNGSPLTAEDLKGKVVLLDFWAVWCGPCIATFPHLREWNEKYSEEDFVIVGLTRYYKYTWNDAANRASRAADPNSVTPEQENEMLKKFAEHHNLHHRFAIQSDSKLSEYYAVSGIPHVVVIDKEGIIRLIRVGSGEANAKAIGEMIEKLVKS